MIFKLGAPVFVAAVQGMSLSHLALVATGAFIPGCYGMVTIREFLATSYHTQDTGQIADWSTCSFSLWKRDLLAVPGALVWDKDIWFGIYLGIYWCSLRGWRIVYIIFALSFCFVSALQSVSLIKQTFYLQNYIS